MYKMFQNLQKNLNFAFFQYFLQDLASVSPCFEVKYIKNLIFLICNGLFKVIARFNLYFYGKR